MSLVTDVYGITKTFPKEERYDLTSQMRRAAVSVPSNIAEGSQRTSKKDFSHFILMAKGSLAEVRTQVHIAKNLGYISSESANELFARTDEISRMTFAFFNALKSEV